MRVLRCILTGSAVVAILTGAYAHAAEKPYVANEKVCKRPAQTELAWLDATWAPFIKHIRVCKVLNEKSVPALMLISVWADLYYSEKPNGTETVIMPKPLLVTPRGKKVGELPVNFPSDPPSELVIHFTNWRQGFPYEIRLCVVSPGGSGNQALSPLKYMPTTRRYEQVAGAGAKAYGDCDAR